MLKHISRMIRQRKAVGILCGLAALLVIAVLLPRFGMVWGDPKSNVVENAEVARCVAALSAADNETRARAAASLRRILAADPDQRSNDHGEGYWRKRASGIKAGMKHSDVVKLFPPYDQKMTAKDLLWTGPGSGQSHYGMWRLDHYWSVSVPYRNPDTVLETPKLLNEAMSIWVAPPKNYSGPWVTFYVNGQKANEIQYANGIYHGTFTSYRDDGEKSFEQHYGTEGCSGPDTGWYRNGRKMYVGQYANGKQAGTWTNWFEDGTLRSIEQFKDGEWDGVRTSWYPNGRMQYEEHYAHGKKNGTDRAWSEGGGLLWSREYKDDKNVSD